MNLLALAGRLAAESDTAVAFTPEHCLHSRDRFAACDACFSLCPTGAIRPGQPPHFQADACQKCLACLPACPSGAYTGLDEAPDLLQCAARLKAGTLELLCQYNPHLEGGPPHADAAIRVRGCLAGLGASAYLLLWARGASQIIVRDDACAGCPWQETLHPALQTRLEETRRLLAAWEEAPDVAFSGPAAETWRARPLYKADSPPVSRRELFSLTRQADEETQRQTVPDGRHPFRERLRTLQAIRRLPPPQRDTAVSPTSHFALLTVSDACSADGTCARTCPTGALQLEKEDGRFRLNFLPQACIACDACVHLCAREAISIDHAPSAAALFSAESGGHARVLYEAESRRCARCNAVFIPDTAGQRLCIICAYRAKNPFGASLPPGLMSRLAQQRKKNEAAGEG
jgi:Fe-S-cluster-containing hydrogenase component 2